MRLKRRKAILDTMNIAEESADAKIEQNKNLDDLMGQL
jgi:hypothetical protein